jgi:hypothetical protein
MKKSFISIQKHQSPKMEEVFSGEGTINTATEIINHREGQDSKSTYVVHEMKIDNAALELRFTNAVSRHYSLSGRSIATTQTKKIPLTRSMAEYLVDSLSVQRGD